MTTGQQWDFYAANGYLRLGRVLSGSEQATRYCPAEKVVPLELAAGQSVLLHSSNVNRTEIPRRATWTGAPATSRTPRATPKSSARPARHEIRERS